MRIKSLIFFSALLSGSLSHSQVDSLIGLLKSKRGLERVPILNEICYQLAFSEPARAIQYGTESMSLLKGADSSLMASTYNDASFPYYSLGNYQKMIELNRKALDIRAAIKDSIGQAASYSKIGLAFEELGMLDSALVNDEAALAIYTDLNNDANRIAVLNNVSNIYERLGNLDEALKLHAEIQSTAKRIGDSFSYYKSFGNESNVLTKLKKYDLAEQKLSEAEAFFTKEGAGEQLASSYLMRGINFKGMGDTLTAITYYKRAHEKYVEHGVLASQPLINLGNTYLEIGQVDSAEHYLVLGVGIAEQTKSYTQLRHAYGALALLEEKRNNFSKSLEYLKLKYVYQDSIFTESISDRISEYQIAYQTEKAEKLSIEEQQKRTEAELKLSNRNKWIYGISGAFLAVIFLALLLTQVRARKAQAERNRAILEEREKGLEAVFSATEEERQRIARDLHDGIGQQMSGIKLAMSSISVSVKSKNGEESDKMEELLKILDGTASEIRDISHRMMPKVLEQFGLVPALQEMLDKSLRLSGIKHEFEHFNFEGRLDRKIELALYRVTQELINNVIKHAKATAVTVQIFRNGAHLIMIVEDNGKGIESERSGDGQGLMNIRSRLNTIHGDVNFQGSPEVGTTATIRVKL